MNQKHLEETLTGSKEPYDWERMTIHIGVTLFPNDGSSNGRMISLAAWSHKDAPLVDTIRSNDLGPDTINTLLVKLRETLPSREQIAIERHRLEQEKKAKEAQEKTKKDTKAKQQAANKKKTPAAKTKTPTKAVPIPKPQGQNSIEQKQQSLFGE